MSTIGTHWGVRALEPAALRRLAQVGGFLYLVSGLSTLPPAFTSGVFRDPRGIFLAGGVAVVLGLTVLAIIRPLSDERLLRIYPPMAVALVFFAGINITAGVYAAGLDKWAVGTVLYLLAPILGFYVLSKRLAVLGLVLVGAEYGWLLAVSDSIAVPFSNWLFLMAVLTATGYLLGGWVEESDRLASSERRAREQLAEANRQKSAFMAAMSHELRTPMNAIIGFSEVLETQVFGELNDRQLDYVHDVVTSGRHLLSLINDILDLSKIEAGRMELTIDDVDVASLVDHAVGFVRAQAAAAGISLTIELDPEVGEVQADHQKLLQALVNLLSNAVKFTPDGGRVTIAATRSRERVAIAVTDTGPGIPPADRERIFEEFAQGRAAVDGRQPGTGLGLALARRYTELHEGSLSVVSEPGSGSTFRLEVPVGATLGA